MAVHKFVCGLHPNKDTSENEKIEIINLLDERSRALMDVARDMISQNQMKKILLSLGAVIVLAGVIVGGTIAFYNDAEASTGNIFVAGSIDLKVDHKLQTYNGVDCETCSVEVYSSTATKVVAASVGASEQGPFPIPAVDVSSPHPLWQDEAALSPAQWIWATDPTTDADMLNGAEYTFQNKFQWNAPIAGVDLELSLAADNGYKIILNGVTIVDKLLTEFNYGAAVSLTAPEETALMGAMVLNGQNTLEIVVRNKPEDVAEDNPAGLLFKLNIHRPQEDCEADSAFQLACRLWEEKDLEGGDTFFNFDDVKPADYGTNVISLHVSSNDAYACLIVGDKDDQENPAQPLAPELVAGDLVGVGNSTGFGELSNFLNVFTWEDADGDGVYDLGEDSLGSGPLSSLTSIMSMDSINEQFLVSTTTQYIGLAWCAGALTPNQGSPFTCDGDGMGNIAQTDSFSASLTAYVEQVRNNSTFTCEYVSLPTQPE